MPGGHSMGTPSRWGEAITEITSRNQAVAINSACIAILDYETTGVNNPSGSSLPATIATTASTFRTVFGPTPMGYKPGCRLLPARPRHTEYRTDDRDWCAPRSPVPGRHAYAAQPALPLQGPRPESADLAYGVGTADTSERIAPAQATRLAHSAALETTRYDATASPCGRRGRPRCRLGNHATLVTRPG